MRSVIATDQGGPLGAIRSFLGLLLRKGVVDAVLVPVESAAAAVVPALVADPALLERANPLAPVMGLNTASVVGKLSKREPRGRVAAVLRACELRALVELVKVLQADLTDVLTIGVDCLGTYDVPTYRALVRSIGSGAALAPLIAGAAGGELRPGPGTSFRDACRMCEWPHSSTSDISVELFGADLADGVPVRLPDDVGKELGLAALGAPEPARRSQALSRIVSGRSATRDAILAVVEERLEGEGIDGVFSSCVRCHNCMTVCPVCYCRTCLFLSPTFEHEPAQYIGWALRKGACRLPVDTTLFHLTRLNHMVLSCVGCGMCTSGCPSDLPVGTVFRSIGRRLQETFDYAPGRDVTEPLPLITFEEDEWMEVGEE